MSATALPVRRLACELLGSALLMAVVIGSGAMGVKLAGGNVALALLCNSIATGLGLFALILTFGHISGAHFNPAVTVSDALAGGMPWRQVPGYVAAQVAGCCAGVILAHAMFELPLVAVGTTERTGWPLWLGEFVATFGLIAVIHAVARTRPTAVAAAVAAYIGAGYWFTSSTSFANPAGTLSRTLSLSFGGMRPIDAPAYVVAQFLGMFAATVFIRWAMEKKE